MIIVAQSGRLPCPQSKITVLTKEDKIYIDGNLLWDFSQHKDASAFFIYKEAPKRFIKAIEALDEFVSNKLQDDVCAFIDYLRELCNPRDVISKSPEKLCIVFRRNYLGFGPFSNGQEFAKFYCEELGYLDVPSYLYNYIDYELVAYDLFNNGELYMSSNGYVFFKS